MKGAVERVLDRCSHIGIGQIAKLEASNKEEIIAKMDEVRLAWLFRATF